MDIVNLRRFLSETLADVQYFVLVAIRFATLQTDFCKCIETSENVLPTRRRWMKCGKFRGVCVCGAARFVQWFLRKADNEGTAYRTSITMFSALVFECCHRSICKDHAILMHRW